MRNTFPKASKFPFRLVKNTFFCWSNDLFKVCLQENSLTGARIGWVVPKRKVRLARDRNTCKRLIRDTFRESEIKQKGADILIKVQVPFVRKERLKWRENLLQVWDYLCKNY